MITGHEQIEKIDNNSTVRLSIVSFRLTLETVPVFTDINQDGCFNRTLHTHNDAVPIH